MPYVFHAAELIVHFVPRCTTILFYKVRHVIRMLLNNLVIYCNLVIHVYDTFMVVVWILYAMMALGFKNTLHFADTGV